MGPKVDFTRVFQGLDLDKLPEEDRIRVAALLEYIGNGGDTDVLTQFFMQDYESVPVTPADFLSNYHYIGPYHESLYPKWREEIDFVLDPTNAITEWIIYGSIGTGKTTAACIAQLYKLYTLTCMKNPQKMFGLAPHLPMYFAFFSTTKGKAEDAINAKFQAMLNLSPYFRETLPKNQRKVFMPGAANLFGPGYKEHPKKDDLYELIMPHNLHLLFGSQTTHALSLDVFSATLDEMNFRAKKSVSEADDENSAQALYRHVRTRIESRFLDSVGMPGLVINISSARSSDSFVEQRIVEVRKGDLPGVHISDFALWDVKPGRYSPERFKVFVGSGFRTSRILEEKETVGDLKTGEQIVTVPETFRPSFEADLAGAIRDLAGVPTASVDKLFKRREILLECQGTYANAIHPETIQVGLDDGREVSDYFDIDLVTRYDNMKSHLLYYPTANRFVHVDLAQKGDCAGITSLCIPYYYEKKIPRTDDFVEPVVQKLPFIFVDFFCRITNPKMDEIAFDKVRQFLVWLRDDVGYPTTRITYDSWQSIHSIQLLKQNGFLAESLSVDRTDEPYMELLAAYNSRRVLTPKYEFVLNELRMLDHDIRVSKGAVDHPPSGSKDVADSFAGAYANALKYINENGFAAVGAYKVTQKVIESLFRKSPRELRAAKVSKELGYDEPVTLDSGYEGRFHGVSTTAR
jgi:hypothetical protein